MMSKELFTYLQWRFLRDCFPKYRQYCDEWISNITGDQLSYFMIEMERLTKNGIYKGL